MNLPPDSSREPTNDRRSVPRHIRDGEHDSFEDTMAGIPPASGPRLVTVLVCIAAVLVAAFGAWFALA